MTGELDEATARFKLPRHGPVAVAPTELAAQVAALRADLQSPNSNYARALLAAELERLERALAVAEAEYSAATTAPSHDPDELRAAAAALLAELARSDAADLRGPLAAFGVFYVADKGLALPPEF